MGKKSKTKPCKTCGENTPQPTSIEHYPRNHAESVRMVKQIRQKWAEGTKLQRGYFIRFINGNTLDCRVSNLALCHPRDAFININNWKVDWDCDLSEVEIQFVRDNLENFLTLYT